MKRLNNKGFAISTVIYGLAIMGIMLVAILMATMASTRSNSRQLAKSIEEELNRFSKTETFINKSVTNDAKKIPKAQEYIVPATGWYKIELWGSKGAGDESNGAYTSGVIRLNEGDILYFYVGQGGTGRETDVRIVNGDYSDPYSAGTRIMVAAGGGSNKNAPGGTLIGYSSNMKSLGGYIDVDKNKTYSLYPTTETTNGTNGTLIGCPKNYTESNVKQQQPGVVANPQVTTHQNGVTGGGDGYVPSSEAGVGGVSYIAGYAGNFGYENDPTNTSQLKVSNNPIMHVYEQEYNVDTDSGVIKYGHEIGKYYFIDGIMLPDVKTNGGHGRAKIERMVISNKETLTKKTDKLNGITAVQDCVKSTTPTMSVTDLDPKIYGVIKGEENLSGVARSKTTDASGNTCFTWNFNNSKSFDEIAIIYKSGYDYKSHTISVKKNGSFVPIVQSADLGETATPTGFRISAYQFDSSLALPERGNYYIKPVLTENKYVSAPAGNTVSPLSIDSPNGYKRQRWSIEKIEGTDYYKISELSRYNAMEILEDENIIGNSIGADSPFNKNAQDDTQYWKIIPMHDGTYKIETGIPSFDDSKPSGNIIAQTNQRITATRNNIIIGPTNNNTARFRLISVDYSSS